MPRFSSGARFAIKGLHVHEASGMMVDMSVGNCSDL